LRANTEVVDQLRARRGIYLDLYGHGDRLVRRQSSPVTGDSATILRAWRRCTGAWPSAAGKTGAYETGSGRKHVSDNQIVAVVRPLIADQQAIGHRLPLVDCGGSGGREQSKIGRDDHLGNEASLCL
jgi:hypothetical protein